MMIMIRRRNQTINYVLLSWVYYEICNVHNIMLFNVCSCMESCSCINFILCYKNNILCLRVKNNTAIQRLYLWLRKILKC